MYFKSKEHNLIYRYSNNNNNLRYYYSGGWRCSSYDIQDLEDSDTYRVVDEKEVESYIMLKELEK